MTARKSKPAPKPSPWRSGPHCDTPAARKAYARYRAQSNRKARAP